MDRRLCVDLRSLNNQVIKQKYPFPVIEDHLSKLGDKRVFTLLDLKDGYHLITIHPDNTKYFAFVHQMDSSNICVYLLGSVKLLNFKKESTFATINSQSLGLHG